MQTVRLLIVTFFSVLATVASAHTSRGIFKWSDPSSLVPAYPAPTSDNRYGEYIGSVTFTDNGIKLLIDDSDVAQLSQRARFLYGYVTQEVEMRAYPGSDIIITAPEGMTVNRVVFEGAKADGNYLTSYDENSTFQGQEWTTSAPTATARFLVDVTINCTSITVICTDNAGIDDIKADAIPDSGARWFTITGMELSGRPYTPGLYIKHHNNSARRIIIR